MSFDIPCVAMEHKSQDRVGSEGQEESPEWMLSLVMIPVNSGKCIWQCESGVMAVGKILDPVMSMGIEDYCFLCRRFGNLNPQVSRFFEKGVFDVTLEWRCIGSIFVPSGCQLTFLNWLGLQPGFDIRTLRGMILVRVFERRENKDSNNVESVHPDHSDFHEPLNRFAIEQSDTSTTTKDLRPSPHFLVP
jgi:hypothetical protein